MTELANNQIICWALALISFYATGCAVQYRNDRAGTEHLWGIGRFRVASQIVNSNLVSVTSGSCVPGLGFEFGSGGVGLSFGYLVHEKLIVARASSALKLGVVPSTFALTWSDKETDSVWGLGHLKMNSVPFDHQTDVIITGTALAGLKTQFEKESSGIDFGFRSRQQLVFLSDQALDFEQSAAPWPGFDFYSMSVAAPLTDNSK